jgi:hypothetical protein
LKFIEMTNGSGRTRLPDKESGIKAAIRIGVHQSFTSNMVPLQVKEKPLPAATKCMG